VLPSFQTPTTASNLLDSLEVRISVIRHRFTREDRISPGWDEGFRTSFSRRFVDFTTVMPTIGREAFHRIRHLLEELWKRGGIGEGSVGELDGQDVPSLVCGYISTGRSRFFGHLSRPLATESRLGGLSYLKEGANASCLPDRIVSARC
jgi:hypothetical protein